MNVNILVTGALYSSQSAYSALRFCQAAVAAGHSISQVFFYQDGVTQANLYSLPLDDEFDAVNSWVRFSQQTSTPLVVCVSAGERRGLMSDEQVLEHHLGRNAAIDSNGSAHSQFSVAGLGVLHQASLDSERMVTFK